MNEQTKEGHEPIPFRLKLAILDHPAYPTLRPPGNKLICKLIEVMKERKERKDHLVLEGMNLTVMILTQGIMMEEMEEGVKE